jgi:hypothetical protein
LFQHWGKPLLELAWSISVSSSQIVERKVDNVPYIYECSAMWTRKMSIHGNWFSVSKELQRSCDNNVVEDCDQVIELVLFPTGRSVFDSTKVAHHCRCGGGKKDGDKPVQVLHSPPRPISRDI